MTLNVLVVEDDVGTADGAIRELTDAGHVPLVVAGPSVLDPYVGLETVVLNRTYDVVEPCEQAAAAELVEHGRRAEAAVTDCSLDGSKCVPTVTVTRRAGGLRVHVAGLETLTAQDRQAVVVRILDALHVFDRSARTVDVVVGEARA